VVYPHEFRENHQIRKRSATAFCPCSEQQIEYRFSRSSVNACGVDEHPIELEDRHVKVAVSYLDCRQPSLALAHGQP
jgi:hypothetical protein